MPAPLSTARILLTIPALFLALVPPLVDFTPTHVLNPLWSPHARLHTVWLLGTNALVCIVALGLLWRPVDARARERVLLAAGLIGSVLAGFFIAAATHPLYGGALTDVNGVEGTVAGLDLNLITFSVLGLDVAAAAFLAWRGRRA